MAEAEIQTSIHRTVMALVGGLAGLAAWYFGELADSMQEYPRLYMLCLTGVMGFFGILLGLVGQLNWFRAAAGAAILAVTSAGLLTWASFRFDRLEPFFDGALPVAALALLVFIGTPFAAAGLQRRGGALDYPLLFDTAWGILVRYLAGVLFVAVVWLIVYLSHTLLEIVGVTVIGDVLAVDPVPFALTGVFLGLALAIMHELRDYVSPFLVLRLFRVLLPVLTVVVAVFLVALPLRGLDHLFGSLSVAATLMAVTIAAITLITSALDRNEVDEAQAATMRWAARAMSLLLPFLAAAAVYAVWPRVDAYGWTPERLAAALSAGLLQTYALAYAISVLGNRGWTGRVRRVNLVMAMVVLALAALWLTPVLHAEAISSRSQLARFEDGDASPVDLPLWELKEDWGKAGARALAQLREIAETGEDARTEKLVAALQRLDAADSRYGYDHANDPGLISEDEGARIMSQLVVLPAEQAVTAAELATLQPHVAQQLRDSCPRGGAGGSGCVLVLGDLNPMQKGDEGVLLLRGPEGGSAISITSVRRVDGAFKTGRLVFADLAGDDLSVRALALSEAIRAGDIQIVPSGLSMIRIGGIDILP